MLFVGRLKRTYRAHLEVATLKSDADATATIRAFCRLIQRLPTAQRKLWDDAKGRDFSVGIGAGTDPAVLDVPIAADVVKMVSDLNARIVITVYPTELAES